MKPFPLIAILGGLVFCGTAQMAGVAIEQRPVDAKVLAAPNMPVAIVNATVNKGYGRGLSKLDYTVTNYSKKTVTSLQVTLFVLDSAGRVRGGEGWRELVNLKPAATGSFSVSLKNNVVLGDRVVLVLEGATGQKGNWVVGIREPELLNAAKRYAILGHYTVPGARYVAAAQGGCPSNFCTGKLREAKEACGSSGLQSFSCGQSQCEFSFTCKGPGPILD
jgi:hypothetical protein